eukprot:6211981-Pleurochrysis_carterae.AAC.2
MKGVLTLALCFVRRTDWACKVPRGKAWANHDVLRITLNMRSADHGARPHRDLPTEPTIVDSSRSLGKPDNSF